MNPTAVDDARAVLTEVLAYAEIGQLPSPLAARVGRALAGLDIEASAGALLSVDQVAHRLAVSPDVVRRRVRAGVLPAVRIGRAIRVPASVVEDAATPHRAA